MPNNGKRLMSTSPSSEGSDIGTNKKQRRVCKESTTSSGKVIENKEIKFISLKISLSITFRRQTLSCAA